ncbi:NADPH dehydrogenase NamA [Paraliobacillus sp. JSM ZJ581]|uniref:NADPH dehydrogenase NamA n=1 Tax=Paraliobacillus sp. JSM ZJ581 TaxID=3342118 RepID=UPI0035A8E232
MEHKLFSPITFKEVTLKNRIVMSPMCMYACEPEDGTVQDFHVTHYESRAVGQVGLIMLEATAVQPEGRISTKDLGIWCEKHIEGLKKVSDRIHTHGAKSSIQLAHAGRKANLPNDILAPSAIAFNENYKTPNAMSIDQINETIQSFKVAADRANQAGFDVIEIHAAHGYLINQFLSPLTNKRTDSYGGAKENRYRFLSEILEAIKTIWKAPIFVRISADEYHKDGNNMEDFIYYAEQLKKQGVSLIDCSTGGVVPATIQPFPGYQVPKAEILKKHVAIPTGAVGLITSSIQAEEVLQNNRADLIFLGRELLRNPYWAKQAANELQFDLDAPKSYERGWL